MGHHSVCVWRSAPVVCSGGLSWGGEEAGRHWEGGCFASPSGCSRSLRDCHGWPWRGCVMEKSAAPFLKSFAHTFARPQIREPGKKDHRRRKTA